jgi:hypothetical protein
MPGLLAAVSPLVLGAAAIEKCARLNPQVFGADKFVMCSHRRFF